MLVSVIIPLYNKEQHIERTIRSVLKQTHQEFEVIVVDDGSTDRSVEVVRAIDDSRIRLILQANQGVSAARNRGVRDAKTEWVAFLDGDDEYQPEFLETVIRFIEQHSGYDLSMVGANYCVNNQSCPVLDLSIPTGIHDYFELFTDRRTPNNSSTTVVDKQKFLEVGGFPEDVRQFEDWITWCKLALVGSFGYIAEPLGIYYREKLAAGTASRRPSHYLYDGGVAFCRELRCALDRYPQLPLREVIVQQCVNEFVVNTAELLARVGEKKMALRLLTCLNGHFFSLKRTGHFKSLLLHLCVPGRIKEFRIWMRTGINLW